MLNGKRKTLNGLYERTMNLRKTKTGKVIIDRTGDFVEEFDALLKKYGV